MRYRLPWSWSAFDYRELCALLWAQCGDARFETAKVDGARAAGRRIAVRTDRGDLARAARRRRARLAARARPSPHYQPPDAPLSRGLEVHPARTTATATRSTSGSSASLVRRGYGWRVPAGGEARIGVGSYDPRQHVREPTDRARRAPRRAEPCASRATGSRTACARPTDGDVFFVGDSAGHCFPLSGEGIRTAFYFGIAAGRELRAVLAGEQDRASARSRATPPSTSATRRAFRRALRLQRLDPGAAAARC